MGQLVSSSSFHSHHISANIFQCDFVAHANVTHFEIGCKAIVVQQCGQNHFHGDVRISHSDAESKEIYESLSLDTFE